MTNDRSEAAWQAWLRTRPQNVQEFARKYPFHPMDRIDGMWFVGYAEFEGDAVGLMVTPLDPSDDYDAAMAARQYICPDHFE